MKRLSARLAVSLLMIGTSLVWSPGGLAGQPPKGAHSEDFGQALKAYEERKLDHCQKQLENAKKELHELLDLRLTMLNTLAEERLKLQMTVAGMASGHSDTGHSCAEHNAALAKELTQFHSALQVEIEAEHKQIAELGSQIHSVNLHPMPPHQPLRVQHAGTILVLVPRRPQHQPLPARLQRNCNSRSRLIVTHCADWSAGSAWPSTPGTPPSPAAASGRGTRPLAGTERRTVPPSAAL